jgi:hypothetical protein
MIGLTVAMENWSSCSNQLFWVGVLSVLFFGGCGQTPSHRQVERQQYQANTQTERREFLPALGRFEGEFLIYKKNRRYKAVMELTNIYQVVPSPTDQTQMISVPNISGHLTFPILTQIKDEHYMDYVDLTEPMQFFVGLRFNSGNYDPETHQLNLPYFLPQFPTEPWGAIQGKLEDSVFIGIWTTKTEGTVGEFKLTRVSTTRAP